MSRETLTLNGEWQFAFLERGQNRREIVDYDTIKVPACWESEPAGQKRPGASRALYRRTFQAPKHWTKRAVLLHFGAVNYYCQVWVNGRRAGTHEGGFTPFHFAIQNLIKPGENVLEVEVFSPAGSLTSFPHSMGTDALSGRRNERFPLAEIPHGKQSWYASGDGIWQDVYIQANNTLYAVDMYVTPDIDNGRVRVRNTFNVAPPDGMPLHYHIRSGEAEARVTLTGDGQARTFEAEIDIPGFTLWTPEEPTLSEATVSVDDGGDELMVTFGMRKFHTQDNKLFLNNREWYMIGALDQDFYPDTIYTPPSDDYIIDQFRKAKEMGLNLLRCHIKVPDPKYLHWADRMGLLLWCEIPNWWRLTDKAMHRAEQTIREMVERDYNHPSLVIWTVVNEDWGTALNWDGTDRHWVAQMHGRVKEMDPTRLVVDNSACEGNFHVKTDIEDFHFYTSIPDQARRWANWVRSFSHHPDWTFSPWGDDQRTGKEPLVVSEFGNWGLPSLRNLLELHQDSSHLTAPLSGDPWWFRTGSAVVRPEGVADRFQQYRLDAIFGNYEDFATATQWHQYEAMKYEIEQIRRHESIKGYVVTEFTDIYWEPNGLLDLRRNPKAYHEALPMINAEDMVVPLSEKRNYWGGETVEFDVLVSHYGRADYPGCRVRWQGAGREGVLEDVALLEPGVVKAGTVCAPLDDVERARTLHFQLVLETAEGREIARNTWEITVFPSDRLPARRRLRVWLHDPPNLWNLRPALEAAGYDVTVLPETGVDVALVTRVDDIARAFIERGGAAVCLPRPRIQKSTPDNVAPEGQDLFENRSIYTVQRASFRFDRSSKPWLGNWATNFNWAKFEEVFPDMPEENPLGWPFHTVSPEHVLLNFDSREHFDDIHAGMVVGWVHAPVALLAGARYGQGKALISCFRVEAEFGRDPAATTLLHNMLEFAASDAFQPHFDASHPGALTVPEAIEHAKAAPVRMGTAGLFGG